MSESSKPLTPARPDPEELALRPAYMPRIPWRTILVLGGLAAAIATWYEMREHQRIESLRTGILDTYERNLSSFAGRYQRFEERIVRWTMEAAAAGEPQTFVDPQLRISSLHGSRGLYLRLHADSAVSPETIGGAAAVMETDAVTRCLGIAPVSARGLYEAGYFLTPEWLERVRSAEDLMTLRVLEEQLTRNVQVDVPVIASLLQTEYFLLVIQQGESRREAPVDVFLWDMRRERQLLRARIMARGILLPVRLRFAGVPTPPPPSRPPPVFSPGAFDCSIAAQIKALTGEPAMTVSSGSALEEAAAAREAALEPTSGTLPVAAPGEGPAPSEPASAEAAIPAEAATPATP